jgi:hypothetical protein
MNVKISSYIHNLTFSNVVDLLQKAFNFSVALLLSVIGEDLH